MRRLVQHAVDGRDDEAEAVSNEDADVDILAAVDAIQSNDELLGSTTAESLDQVQPTFQRALGFATKILQNRLQIGQLVGAPPTVMDLRPLNKRDGSSTTQSKDPNAPNYCYNRLDRVGIQYVCPNQAQNNVFEMCDSENQDFVGVYTSDGQTLTYTQPPESLGPITSIPYTARIPSSSNCVTYQSDQLFAGLPTVSSAPTPSSVSGS